MLLILSFLSSTVNVFFSYSFVFRFLMHSVTGEIFHINLQIKKKRFLISKFQTHRHQMMPILNDKERNKLLLIIIYRHVHRFI